MKLSASTSPQSAAQRLLVIAGFALIFSLCLPACARADEMSDARDQFARAVTMRTMLEGLLEKDRSLADYKKTVDAYHKVYLITPDSEDCTAALMAEGELYEDMGRLYDAKYYGDAIGAYRFLLKQYPGSRYRGSALLAIATIQKDDLQKPLDAQATYKQYLKLFPHSEKAREVLADLRDTASPIASQPAQPNPSGRDLQLPLLQGQKLSPRVSDGDPAQVTGIRTWNAESAARLIVGLSDTIRFTAARISSPDRIYFDLYKADLNPKFASRATDVTGGLLKSVRVAQNRQGVVRIVLDVNGANDYSAYLMGKPYRLVIEVREPHPDKAPNAEVARQPAPKPPDDDMARDLSSRASATQASRETMAVNARGARQSAREMREGAAIAAEKVATRRSPFGPETAAAADAQPVAPPPTRDGQRSLARVLGLKVRTIVIDPGHGGHDTGTIGPDGLQEKDVCLDVALRLGRIIEQRLPGAQVIYTRRTDVFVPLEQRTSIANQAHADLFISIHANSSPDPQARGIETYYLNFATSPEAMKVAARENATSEEAEHDLPDLLKKIARNDKIEESKELAGDVQSSLSERLQLVSRSERKRGVKKAPFVVLIGANMPSVLAEISFLSNPTDERMMRNPERRERIATGLYRG
ncbi:MAG: N-acetylmuramoyl-L-alanine amidase, partial [Acidobacteriota bacterium]|nr:N-acetylmuramoyl-L-alanine amidase [Acidobacteriota bacterium]